MVRKISAINKRNLPVDRVELELAMEVRTRLGVDVDPRKLAKFVRDRFHILSILAHEIHAAEAPNVG